MKEGMRTALSVTAGLVSLAVIGVLLIPANGCAGVFGTPSVLEDFTCDGARSDRIALAIGLGLAAVALWVGWREEDKKAKAESASNE